MRTPPLTAYVLSAMLALPAAALALEKTSARLTDYARADGWNNGGSCSIVYYNFCTGWIWLWSGWGPNDVLGVAFDNCCAPSALSRLVTSWHLVFSPAPAGYGFTGVIDVKAADTNGCPTGAALMSKTWLPGPSSGWYHLLWFVDVPARFALSVTLGAGTSNPTAFAADHPAAGPTGPAACGTCYSTTRVSHSFYWGTPATPLCPGSTFHDGACDTELIWDVSLSGLGCGPIAVEQNTWGTIKSLYR